VVMREVGVELRKQVLRLRLEKVEEEARSNLRENKLGKSKKKSGFCRV